LRSRTERARPGPEKDDAVCARALRFPRSTAKRARIATGEPERSPSKTSLVASAGALRPRRPCKEFHGQARGSTPILRIDSNPGLLARTSLGTQRVLGLRHGSHLRYERTRKTSPLQPERRP